jgi:hypothetical protein
MSVRRGEKRDARTTGRPGSGGDRRREIAALTNGHQPEVVEAVLGGAEN